VPVDSVTVMGGRSEDFVGGFVDLCCVGEKVGGLG
jgi:hypothetical protein